MKRTESPVLLGILLCVALAFAAFLTAYGPDTSTAELAATSTAASRWAGGITGLAFFTQDVITGCATINTSTTLTTNIQATGSGSCIVLNAENITLDCAGFSVNGSNGTGNGIVLQTVRNATIRNCLVENFSAGVIFSGSNRSIATNVTARNNSDGFEVTQSFHSTVANSVAQGTDTGIAIDQSVNITVANTTSTGTVFHGIIVQVNTINATLLNNTAASLGGNNGIYIINSNSSAVINNTCNSTSGNGIALQGAINTTLSGNTCRSVSGIGIDVTTGSSNSSLTDNAGISESGDGIRVTTQNHRLVRNSGRSRSNAGIEILASNVTLLNNTGGSLSSVGGAFTNVNLTTAVNNTFLSNTSIALFLSSTNNNTFIDTVLRTNLTWLSAVGSLNNSFIGTSFAKPNGSIRITANVSLDTFAVAVAQLDVTANRAFLDSTVASALNRSAEITLNNIVLIDPKPQFNFSDGATFADCTPTANPFCTELSYAGGVYVFNTSHFTTYTVAENVSTVNACAVINTTTSLSANAQSNSTCITINASNLVFSCAGLSIGGNATGIGIDVEQKTNVTIQNCFIENFSTNIYFTGVNNSLIVATTARNSSSESIWLDAGNLNDTVANTTGTSATSVGVEVRNTHNSTLFNVTASGPLGGILLVTIANNNTVRDSRGSSTGSAGIEISTGTENTIINSTGTSNTSAGIRLLATDGNVLINATGRSASSIGVYIFGGSDSTTLIDTSGFSDSDSGITISGSFTNATNASGFSNSSSGILLATTSNNRFVNSHAASVSGTGVSITSASYNTFENTTATTVNGTGISAATATYNNFTNVTLSANAAGIQLLSVFTHNNSVLRSTLRNNIIGAVLAGSAEDNRIENSTVLSNSKAGILVNGSSFQNLIKNVTFLDNPFAVVFAGGNNNTVLNSTLNGTRGALNITGSGFNNSVANSTLVLNATFESSNNITGPTILIYPVQLNITTPIRFSTVLNVSINKVYVNGSFSVFNQTAHIIIQTLFLRPNFTLDAADTGVFTACPASRCTLFSSFAGRIAFSVAGFTGYSSNETAFLNITNMTTAANATFNGTTNSTASGVVGDAFGFAIAAGDINGDGIKDNIIGAPFVPDNLIITAVGRVYVVYGQSPVTPSANVSATSANITIRGPFSNGSAQLGRAVAAGDVNGDGVDDVIFAIPGIHQIGILFGSVGLGTVNIQFNQSNVTINASSLIDLSLAVGDYNADGIKDLAIGEPEFPIFNDEANSSFFGRVSVLFGRASWPRLVNLSQNANATINSTEIGSRFGFAVATGDQNNDSIDDLFVGAPTHNVSSIAAVGEAFSFLGGAGFASTTDALATVIYVGEGAVPGGTQANASTGFSIFANADINNDSFKDVIIGTPRGLSRDTPFAYDLGRVYIVFGRFPIVPGIVTLALDANVTLFGTFGASGPGGIPSGERAGFSLYARDVTNDSISDLFVGAPLSRPNAVSNAGIVYLLYGRSTWPRFLNLSDANTTYADLVENNSFGWSLANGSVLIGAPDAPAQRAAVPGLFESVSGVSFDVPGSGPGHTYDIHEPPPSVPTPPAPAGGGGGGFLGGGGGGYGGPRTALSNCQKSKGGAPGVQFHGVEAAFSNWHACSETSFWNSFLQNEGPFRQSLQNAYDTCCPCGRHRECFNDGLHITYPPGPPRCPKEIVILCDSTPTAGGDVTADDLQAWEECCAKFMTPERPTELPKTPPKCAYAYNKKKVKKCVNDPVTGPTYQEGTLETWIGSPKPECPDKQQYITDKVAPCQPDVSKINECWTDPTAACNAAGDGCITIEPTCPGDPACCSAGPNSVAPGSCTATHIGGGALFTFDGKCKDCKLDCALCDDMPGLSLFRSMGLLGPVNIVKCFGEDKERKFAAVPAWAPIYPPQNPLTPPPKPQPQPKPLPDATDPRIIPPSPGFTPVPPAVIEIDLAKGTIVWAAPTDNPPATTDTADITNQRATLPPVICASGGTPGTRVVSDGWRTPPVPRGYVRLGAFSIIGCAPGETVDVTLNVPNDIVDIKTLLGQETMPTAETAEPECGGATADAIRSQQLGDSRGDTYTVKEMPTIVQQQAYLQSGETAQVQDAGYAVELDNPIGGGQMTMSLPDEDVPLPANPSILPIGAVLQVAFDQSVIGRARVTFPLAVPQFIDPDSIGVYVLLGTTWRQLEHVEIKDGKATAMVDDIGLFLTQDGTGAYRALFSVMGISCASCPKTKLEKVYDGQPLSPRTAVVLVHGITTDALRWQFLIDDFALTRQPFQVWTFAYPLSMQPDDAAKELASQLEAHASEFDRLSFITHSMGGIVTQLALDHARTNGFSIARKAKNAIFAGQPGLGSPAAEVYGRLFAFLLNVKSTAMLYSQDSPMLMGAVQGRQVPRAPGVDYFVIAGNRPYTFTTSLFGTGGGYAPNDGIVTTRSARTVGSSEITDTCKHYFEVPLTHTDLVDARLARQIMGRIVGKELAEEHPDLPIIGYNTFVKVAAKCEPGTYVVIGRRIQKEQAPDPTGCSCGNGVCGMGEDAVSCPEDCANEYQHYYQCRLLPWFWFPVLLILLIVSAMYTSRAIKRHERGPGIGVLLFIALVMLSILLSQHVICRTPPLLGYVLLAFIVALLSITLGHLHRGRGKQGPIVIDDTPSRKLEWLLDRDRWA